MNAMAETSKTESKSVGKDYLPDNHMTMKMKDFALTTLNADLVGVANIERCKHAPLMMSPQGLMPAARSVIVMAVHHPDSVIELDGKEHPQVFQPYAIQYYMNNRLDDMSYRMALFLERNGYKALPIASSNIWRYKGYKGLSEHFAPDVSHMHMAVAAGLAEFGFNGLAITPEFGARNRYVTIITDAELTPSPLIEPGSVCDNCKLCAKHCMSGALWKELDGWNIVKIEDKEYKYAKKNLWRCAWGEHFDLDLDLQIPEKVDEDVIMENVRKHGRRHGEFGSCLRYCLPKKMRYWDKDYSNTPRRKRHFKFQLDDMHRGLYEQIRSIASRWGVDAALVNDEQSLGKMGLTLNDNGYMKEAKSAITLVISHTKRSQEEALREAALKKYGVDFVMGFIVGQAGYDICRLLEKYGFSALQWTKFNDQALVAEVIQDKSAGASAALPDTSRPKGVASHVDCAHASMTVITDAPLPVTENILPSEPRLPKMGRAEFTRVLKNLAGELEVDLAGVAPAARLDKISKELARHYSGQTVLNAYNKADIFQPCDPVVSEDKLEIFSTGDHLKGAKSVLVLGLPMPRGTMENVAITAAEALGPYAFVTYETAWRGALVALNLVRFLERQGHKATWTFDLFGTGSYTATSRGEIPDIFCNSLPAVAAGLARLNKCGVAVSPEHGSNMRYLAIVTDADLAPDCVLPDGVIEDLCAKCQDKCAKACSNGAFGQEVSVAVEGVVEKYRPVDRKRCDWAKRYSLTTEEGNKYQGWDLEVPLPGDITPEKLAEGMRKYPQIRQRHPCNYERCVFSCQHCRPQK